MACAPLIPYLKCKLLKMPQKPNFISTDTNKKRKFASTSSSSSSTQSSAYGTHYKKSRKSYSDTDSYSTATSSDFFSNDDLGHLIYTPGDVMYERYKILGQLGEGTFGRVMKVLDMDKDVYLALKVVRNVRKYREAALLEINVLDKLEMLGKKSERMFVKMFNWFDFRGHICITFELLGLSIFDFMKLNKYKPYPIDQVKQIGFQLCNAVKFLHENFLTHTDLKPENILFVNSDYEFMKHEDYGDYLRLKRVDIKLIDFGSATFDDEHHSRTISTRHYRAPEVLLELGWSQPCDVWAIGCILFEITTAMTLFQTHDNLEHLAIMQKIFGNIPKNMTFKTTEKYFNKGKLCWDERTCSARMVRDNCRKLRWQLYENIGEKKILFDLVLKMLEYEPYKRITMREVLKTPIFTNVQRMESVRSVCKAFGDVPVDAACL